MAIRWKCVSGSGRSWLSPSLPAAFVLHYKTGARVKAPEGSLGIFTFKTKKQAEFFLKATESEGRSSIKKVRTFGRGKRLKVMVRPNKEILCNLVSSELKYLLVIYSSLAIFKGTFCYPEVEVLT